MRSTKCLAVKTQIWTWRNGKGLYSVHNKERLGLGGEGIARRAGEGRAGGCQRFLRNVCNNRSRLGSTIFILCETGMSFWVGGGCHTLRFVFKWR